MEKHQLYGKTATERILAHREIINEAITAILGMPLDSSFTLSNAAVVYKHVIQIDQASYKLNNLLNPVTSEAK